MPFAYTTFFSLIEWLAITGFVQCALILVYIVFRVRNWRQASLVIGYFAVLGLSFALQFAMRLEDYSETIRLMLWTSRTAGPPLCYLLVLQIAKVTDLPERKHFWVLALVPLALVSGVVISHFSGSCERGLPLCPRFFEWLYWLGGMVGGLSMLLLWANRSVFEGLWGTKGSHERYWLVLSLVAANVLTVIVKLSRLGGTISIEDADALQIALGLAFVYLAMTSMFRVYPPPVQLSGQTRLRSPDLSDDELRLAEEVRRLMEVDKVYQEPTFSRADLARELKTSESTLSRVINIAFGKSFPKLLNDLRIEEAKIMLRDPSIPVQVIAFESGFNSLASFNRVFREVTGETPTAYRAGVVTGGE